MQLTGAASRLTQGRRCRKQGLAKPSRASSSSSAVVDDGGIQGPSEAQPDAGKGGGGVQVGLDFEALIMALKEKGVWVAMHETPCT